MNTIEGPLKGIKILDIGTMLAAPLAGSILADQGAEVIKVETPGLGDLMRYVGASCNGLSALWQMTNRGKRSLALNLKVKEGLDILYKLVEDTDVVLHNFRPGVSEKLGVDYKALKKVNPNIIYLSVTGFGDTGPYANRAAYDNVVQAFSGVAYSQADIETGEPRQYYQIFGDKLTAVYASQAITSALLARERNGKGQEVKLSMVDALASFMWPDVAGVAMFKDENANPGQAIAKGVPLIKFKNGYGQAAPINDAHFHGWCAAFGVNSSAPELATMLDRMSNKEAMEAISAEVFERALELDVDETIAKMVAADVPCAKAMHLHELPDHPQLQANKTFVESTHPVAGPIIEPKNPANFSDTPAGVAFHSATLGQHSNEILSELNFDDEAIKRFRADNVIA